MRVYTLVALKNGWGKKQPYAVIEIQASEKRCLETKAMDPIVA